MATQGKPSLAPMPPQRHIPVHHWAGAPETMLVPPVQGGVIQTIQQHAARLLDVETHHVVLFDSKAG